MADFKRIKYENLKLKRSQIANQLGYSTSTIQRYRTDIKMPSPYRINPNNTNRRTKKPSNNNSDNNSHRERDVKRPQITSNDLKTTRTLIKNRTILKAGSTHKNIEINDQNLGEILDNTDK